MALSQHQLEGERHTRADAALILREYYDATIRHVGAVSLSQQVGHALPHSRRYGCRLAVADGDSDTVQSR